MGLKTSNSSWIKNQNHEQYPDLLANDIDYDTEE